MKEPIPVPQIIHILHTNTYISSDRFFEKPVDANYISFSASTN
jgi:hypothetical protein